MMTQITLDDLSDFIDMVNAYQAMFNRISKVLAVNGGALELPRVAKSNAEVLLEMAMYTRETGHRVYALNEAIAAGLVLKSNDDELEDIAARPAIGTNQT